MKTLTSCGLALAFLTNTASSAVTYTTDSSSSLVGSFSLDIVAENGTGTTIANFPHFHFDLIDNDGYTSGDSQFFVNLDLNTQPSAIVLQGEDLLSAVVSATRSYDTTGLPANYPDFSGTYPSPFDGQTISYSYTDVGFSGDIVTGNFSFNVVPEPSSTLFALLSLPLITRRRRKS